MIGLRRAARIGAGLFVTVMVGSAALLLWLWFQHSQVVVLPKPSGPYAVGRVGYDWTDETRPDTLGPDPKAKRELMVWVWYPAAPQAGATPAAYLPGKWGEVRYQNAGLFANLLTQRLSAVHAHAVADANLAPSQPTYPVLMMGPGLGPLATDYTTLAEDLASHGYVVVGVNVTYITSVVVFADGRVARSKPMANVPNAASPEESERIMDRLIELWIADERFVLNQMAQLSANDQQGRFTGRLDLRRVGVFGHSFGGATALEVCRVDVRCKAGVNLDGYAHEDVIKLGLQQPFMFIWSEPSDRTNARWQQAVRNAKHITNQIPQGGYQFMIKGARHLNFADYAVLYVPLLKRRGSPGSIDGARGLHITTNYVRSFFDRYLKYEDAPLLDGVVQVYPEIGAP